jgi:hypothetical protein
MDAFAAYITTASAPYEQATSMPEGEGEERIPVEQDAQGSSGSCIIA